ncbi:MAG: vWA domain-containing protein [Bacteroidota bacterium]
MKSKIVNNFTPRHRLLTYLPVFLVIGGIMMLMNGVVYAALMELHTTAPAITIAGKLNTPVMSEQGGPAFLQLTVTTPIVDKEMRNRPMNLSVVIDRSGSMSDQRKMEYAKKAFASLIDQLQPNDLLSLIVYDDTIDILRQSKKVGEDRASIKRMLDEIGPRGSTNLGGGLLEGLKQAERFAGKEYVNRVILLSDGLANVGVTDPRELQSMARRYRNRSIAVTTMGVGLDYNENLMMGLSENGGGNYYFIEHPASLASIVRREFDMVSSVAAQNASITITLGDHVTLNNVLGCDHTEGSGTVIIPIGDLYSNETREFTVELNIPAGTGKRTIASGELHFESESFNSSVPVFSAGVRYTKDIADIRQNRDLQIQAKADIALSASKVEKAMEAIDNGDQASASIFLKDARETMSNSPAAAASGASGESVRSQMIKVETYQKTIREESDTRRAKKSIQYDNYRTRTNK